MRRLTILLALAACGGQTGGPTPGAHAELRNAAGNQVAVAMLYQAGDGVRIRIMTDDIPAGVHGFHVHEVGRCEPPFESAGGHFNPRSREHGFLNPNGPHAGDLVNIPADPPTVMETTAAGLSIDALFDGDGSALVIHAGADDYRTNPSGSSGDRIACGVIRRP